MSIFQSIGKMKSFIIIILVAISCVESKQEKSTADLFRALEIELNDRDEMRDLFDIGDFDHVTTLLKIFDEHGFDGRMILKDNDLISGFLGIFNTADKKTAYTTYNFAYQISCYQGKNNGIFGIGLYAYNKYNDYGCHCGAGISSGKPLDETDRCCVIHDNCYRAAEKTYKVQAKCDTYTTSYTVTCCKAQKITKCNDDKGVVSRALCECDQAMSRCISTPKALRQYRSSYKNVRKRCPKPNQVFGAFDILESCSKIRSRSYRIRGRGQGSCPSSSRRRRSWW